MRKHGPQRFRYQTADVRAADLTAKDIWLYGGWVTPREPAKSFLPVLIWRSLTASTFVVDAGKLANICRCRA